MEQAEQYVTKDMIIADVVAKYPDVAGILTKYGLHCIGCHANPYESIENGSLGHGMSDEEIDVMMNEVNEYIAGANDESEEIENPDIFLTETAAAKIKELMQKEGDYKALRVSVLPGGCSGMTYGMEFAKANRDDDIVLEKHGVTVFVDKTSMKKLAGVQIDYVEGLQGAGFKIENPNATSSCGCGKSFH